MKRQFALAVIATAAMAITLVGYSDKSNMYNKVWVL